MLTFIYIPIRSMSVFGRNNLSVLSLVAAAVSGAVAAATLSLAQDQTGGMDTGQHTEGSGSPTGSMEYPPSGGAGDEYDGGGTQMHDGSDFRGYQGGGQGDMMHGAGGQEGNRGFGQGGRFDGHQGGQGGEGTNRGFGQGGRFGEPQDKRGVSVGGGFKQEGSCHMVTIGKSETGELFLARPVNIEEHFSFVSMQGMHGWDAYKQGIMFDQAFYFMHTLGWGVSPQECLQQWR